MIFPRPFDDIFFQLSTGGHKVSAWTNATMPVALIKGQRNPSEKDENRFPVYDEFYYLLPNYNHNNTQGVQPTADRLDHLQHVPEHDIQVISLLETIPCSQAYMECALVESSWQQRSQKRKLSKSSKLLVDIT